MMELNFSHDKWSDNVFPFSMTCIQAQIKITMVNIEIILQNMYCQVCDATIEKMSSWK